jgi:hypothetical protein
MAYIGNQVSSVPFIIDTFSGTGSASVFGQLTRAPAGVASIAVFISGVYKTPGVDYTLNGDLILFTSAPALGTNNIVIHHMGNGSATSVPSDGSVTGAKLAANTVRGNNIVAGQITGNLIAAGSISGNQIGVRAISGNNIGTGAVSANNFAGGGITSNVLASNLSISLTRASESANINAIAPSGLINIDVANNVVFYFNANTTANITFNLRANTQNTFDSITTTGQSTTVALIVKHGTTRHIASLQIDGTLITNSGANSIVYVGNTKPNFQAITNQETNIYGYTVLKTAANTYAVFASNSLFALG